MIDHFLGEMPLKGYFRAHRDSKFHKIAFTFRPSFENRRRYLISSTLYSKIYKISPYHVRRERIYLLIDEKMDMFFHRIPEPISDYCDFPSWTSKRAYVEYSKSLWIRLDYNKRYTCFEAIRRDANKSNRPIWDSLYKHGYKKLFAEGFNDKFLNDEDPIVKRFIKKIEKETKK